MSDFDETAWWGSCANTHHEESKQQVYAARMGLQAEWGGAHPPTYDIGGRSVIDLGGGPVSLLLKCRNRGRCVVVDPGDFPPWVFARYEHCGIGYWHGPAEEIDDELLRFDEAWLYNVLTHTDDPERIIRVAQKHSTLIRIFEWLEIPPRPGHPAMLHAADLDAWLGAIGFATRLDERGCVGLAYYGVFDSKSRE